MELSNKKLSEEELISKLKERYDRDGLRFADHLAGLIHNRGVHYWDYISVDTLLTLQKPITDFPDEIIFITYHQICELYFKLCIHELSIISNTANQYLLNDEDWKAYLKLPGNWVKHLNRIFFYFENLVESMHLMHKRGDIHLLDRKEFTNFRLSLLPASGFQTAQFRIIEIMLTDLENLQHKSFQIDSNNLHELYENIYWKSGAVRTGTLDEKTGKPKKTKTLIDFESRYDKELEDLAERFQDRNLYVLFRQTDEVKTNEEVIVLLKKIDQIINDAWKRHHRHVIEHHLSNKSENSGNDEQGGGGTNWKEYLPTTNQDATSVNQDVIYFPVF